MVLHGVGVGWDGWHDKAYKASWSDIRAAVKETAPIFPYLHLPLPRVLLLIFFNLHQLSLCLSPSRVEAYAIVRVQAHNPPQPHRRTQQPKQQSIQKPPSYNLICYPQTQPFGSLPQASQTSPPSYHSPPHHPDDSSTQPPAQDSQASPTPKYS